MQAESVKVKNIRSGKANKYGYHYHYSDNVETGKEVQFSLKEEMNTDENTVTELFFKESEEKTFNDKKYDSLSSVRFEPFEWEDKGFTKTPSNNSSSNTKTEGSKSEPVAHRDTYGERIDWEMGEKQRNLSFQGILKCYTELLGMCSGDEKEFLIKKKFVVSEALEDSATIIELLSNKKENNEENEEGN